MDDDVTLIQHFLRGDQRAFDQLVLKHQATLRRMLYEATGDVEDANDLAQEVFIKVYNRLDRFRGQSAFSTWLYRIAVNVLNSHFRRQRLRSFLSLSDAPVAAAVDSGGDYGGLAEELAALLPRLSAQQRGVVVLRAIQGLGVADTARILRTSENVVKVAYHAARLRLRRWRDEEAGAATASLSERRSPAKTPLGAEALALKRGNEADE